MAERPQSYANHRRIQPVLHLVVTPILMVYLVSTIVFAAKAPSYPTILNAVTALALLLGVIGARSMSLVAQDRIIRLEMRLRLAEVLPTELKSRIRELTVGQLVGLRFASDAELPELVRRVFAGELTTNEQIKKAINNWQADWLRV